MSETPQPIERRWGEETPDEFPVALNVYGDKQLWSYAEAASKGGFAPKGMNVHGCYCAMLMGRDLRIAPMQAMQNIAVVNGRPSIYGDLGMALIHQSGLCTSMNETWERPDENDDDSLTAVCTVRRKGMADAFIGRFSVKQAKAAGLWDGKPDSAWAKYPRDMLMWKARWRAYRPAFADLLKGLWFREEAQDIRDVEATVTSSGSATQLDPASLDRPMPSVNPPAAFVPDDSSTGTKAKETARRRPKIPADKKKQKGPDPRGQIVEVAKILDEKGIDYREVLDCEVADIPDDDVPKVLMTLRRMLP